MRKTINIWAETIHDSKHGEQIRVLVAPYAIANERDEISLELHLNTPGEVRMLAEYVANTEAANVELYDIDADVTTDVEPSKTRFQVQTQRG